MKSSTIRRSTLSKESMEVIEALAKEHENDDSIGEYVRPDEIVNSSTTQKENDIAGKAQEIDLLWQNFKATQFNSNSPTMYVLIGFVVGVVATLITMFCIMHFSSNIRENKPIDTTITNQEQIIEEQPQEVENVEAKVVVPEGENKKDETQKSEEKIDTSKMQKYVVKNGDTGESIIKHFYGSYSPEKAEKIIKVNNLKNLDRINIDQELLIPME